MTSLIGEHLTIRPPTEADIPAILGIMTAGDIALTGEADAWSEDDIRDEWRGLELERDAWVAQSLDGALVGYATVTDRGPGRIVADGYVHPAHTGQGIGATLVRLTEARARELAPNAPAGVRVALNTGILAADIAARRLLYGEGYTPARYFWRMRIDMTEAPPAPEWPEGISMRPMAPGHDERAVFDTLEEAFQEHWGHTPEDYDEWRERTMKSESFDPSLWFLARDGTEPAGAIRCRTMGDGSGFVNTLGVRRPWRRKRLGMALLLQAFGTFFTRGIRSVALGVDAQNPTGATRLYEAAGMRVVREFVVYEKELRPGLAAHP